MPEFLSWKIPRQYPGKAFKNTITMGSAAANSTLNGHGVVTLETAMRRPLAAWAVRATSDRKEPQGPFWIEGHYLVQELFTSGPYPASKEADTSSQGVPAPRMATPTSPAYA